MSVTSSLGIGLATHARDAILSELSSGLLPSLMLPYPVQFLLSKCVSMVAARTSEIKLNRNSDPY